MLVLLDYRRRVSELYQRIRTLGTDSAEAFRLFQQMRDELFLNHPQSPLDAAQKAAFNGLQYYNYDPVFRYVAQVQPVENPTVYNVNLGADGQFAMRRFGEVSVGQGTLGVFWIEGYGGGVFLPFKDATSGDTTYGGGRYLYDTIKGADLGSTATEMVLDFNYAYHPSCHYNPNWVCPLAPPQNQLGFPVTAGEMIAK